MARKPILLQMLILIIGVYIATCVILRPPLYLEDSLIDYGFLVGKPNRVVSVTYEPCSFPRADTFAPSLQFDWAGRGSSGAHHEVMQYVDKTRTAIWLVAIIAVTTMPFLLSRWLSRRVERAAGGRFEIIVTPPSSDGK